VTWVSGRLSFAVHEMHEQYGDVVRVAPNRVSFTHPDAWHDVRGHRKSGQGENPKDPCIYMLSTDNILGASRSDHARFRRIISHGFSAKVMQAQQPLITQYVDLLMKRLRERTHGEDGQPRDAVVDLAAWFNFTTFDIIGDLAFGEPFGCLEESRYHPWVYAILDGAKNIGRFTAQQWYFGGLAALVRRQFRSPLKVQVDLARERVQRRLGLEANRPDFLEALITAEDDDGRKLEFQEVVSNARLLAIAGSETTATALTGAAYFLAAHPDVQKKLADEVRTTFASEDEIDLFSVSRLSYLLAVLDESMRLFPPVPAHLPRVCQLGGSVVCGYHLPEGVSDSMDPAQSSRLAELGLTLCDYRLRWKSGRGLSIATRATSPRPTSSYPSVGLRMSMPVFGLTSRDRAHFSHSPLDLATALAKSMFGFHFSAARPFTDGALRSLAYVEMRLILARLIYSYDLAIADHATENFLDLRAFTLWIKKPLNIRLVPVSKK
jgi:cytochrome P450